MDGLLIAVFTLIGILSFGVSAYFVHRNYTFSRDFLRKNIDQAEEDFRSDIHKITLEELMQTKSGRELLSLLTNAEKSEWSDPAYRAVAIEMAKEREAQERMKTNGPHWVVKP